MKTLKFYIILIYLFIFILNIFPASVNVDELNITADGHYDRNLASFIANTYLKFITSFDGGYKFSAKIAFEANILELEKSYRDDKSDFYNKVFMLFRNAEVSARNLADSHLDLIFWTGQQKYLGSGASYHGYLYYPDSYNEDYQGFYRMRGTGITTGLKFWEDRLRMNFHLYENTNFITSDTPDAFYYFSFDSEIGLYFEEIPLENDHFNLIFEIIGGVTFPYDIQNKVYAQFKAGATFGVGNDYVDFFVSAGLPKLHSQHTLSFDDLYLAADIHFKLFVTDHTLSFLTRPRYFNEQLYGYVNEDDEYEGEKNDIDVNYALKIIIPDFIMQWGLNMNFQYSLNEPLDPWHLYIAPFFEINISGVKWNLTTHYDFSRLYMGAYFEGFKVVLSASSKF